MAGFNFLTKVEAQLSSLKPHSIDDNMSEINRIINILKTTPEAPESLYFVQTMVNCIWIGIPIEPGDFNSGKRESLINMLRDHKHYFELKNERIARLKKFIEMFYLRAYRSNIFYGANWLGSTMEFFVDLHTTPALIWLSSYLASLLMVPCHQIFHEQTEAAASKTRIVESGNLSERGVEQLQEDVRQLIQDMETMKKIISFNIQLITSTLNYKQKNPMLSTELAIMYNNLKNSNIFFKLKEIHFEFLSVCLLTQNYTIVAAAMKAIVQWLKCDTISEVEKNEFVTFLFNRSSSTVLYNLAKHDSVKIVESTLLVLIEIYKSGRCELPWNSPQRCTVALNMFRKSKKARKMAGQLILLMLGTLPDEKKLESILYFYVKYKGNPHDMPTLIDTLWDFDYMKDINNIFRLFHSSESLGCDIMNAAIAHFCCAMFNRYSAGDFYDKERIFDFLKHFPALLKTLNEFPLSICILANNHSFRTQFIQYQPLVIGSTKYLCELVQWCRDTVLYSNQYDCLQTAMHIFSELAGQGFEIPNDELANVSAIISKDFVNIIHMWKPTEPLSDSTEGQETVVEIEIDDDLLKMLEIAACKLSILLNHPDVCCDREIDSIYEILNTTIFVEKRFQNAHSKMRLLEIYCLESFSHLLQLRLMRMLNTDTADDNHLEAIKKNVLSVRDRFLELLNQSEASLFIREKTVKGIVHMVLVLQPTLVYAKETRSNLRILAKPLGATQYRLILDKCIDIFCAEGPADSVSDNFKRKMFKNLQRLYTDYSGLPATAIEWKHYAKLLKDCRFTEETNELFLALARLETPFDVRYRRISIVVVAILNNWAYEESDIMDIINRLVNLFKANLEDWSTLFRVIVMWSIQKVNQRVSTTDASRNRLGVLNLMKPFLFSDNATKNLILTELNKLPFDLRSDEQNIIKTFRSNLNRLN